MREKCNIKQAEVITSTSHAPPTYNEGDSSAETLQKESEGQGGIRNLWRTKANKTSSEGQKGMNKNRNKVKYLYAPFKKEYKKIKTLGSGSFGEVRLVRHKVTGEEFAAKVFYKPSSPLYREGDFDTWEVKNECVVMSRLGHSHLVRLYSVYEESDRFTFLLELCSGGNLRDQLSSLYESRESSSCSCQCEAGSSPLPSLSCASVDAASPSEAVGQGGVSECREGRGVSLPTILSPRASVVCSPPSSHLRAPASPAVQSTCLPSLPSGPGSVSASPSRTPPAPRDSSPLLRKRVLDRPTSFSSVGIQALSEVEVAAIVSDLLSALAHMHSRGIAHRDVKLDNIFLRHVPRAGECFMSNEYVLGDFGFSRSLSRSGLLHSYCGSPVYMAPEVIGANGARTQAEATAMGERAYSTKCDVWSVGVVMYSLLTGEYPFAGRCAADTLRIVAHNRLRLDHPALSRLSSSGLVCLRSMLCKDPAYRASASSLLSESLWFKEQVPSRPSVRSHI